MITTLNKTINNIDTIFSYHFKTRFKICSFFHIWWATSSSMKIDLILKFKQYWFYKVIWSSTFKKTMLQIKPLYGILTITFVTKINHVTQCQSFKENTLYQIWCLIKYKIHVLLQYMSCTSSYTTMPLLQWHIHKIKSRMCLENYLTVSVPLWKIWHDKLNADQIIIWCCHNYSFLVFYSQTNNLRSFSVKSDKL